MSKISCLLQYQVKHLKIGEGLNSHKTDYKKSLLWCPQTKWSPAANWPQYHGVIAQAPLFAVPEYPCASRMRCLLSASDYYARKITSIMKWIH